MAAQIQIANLADFQQSLRQAAAQVADLTKPLQDIGIDWLRQNQTIFNSGDRGFADLSPQYKKQKQRQFGFVFPILRATGRLEQSITQPGAPGQIFTIVGASRVQLGTSVRSASGADYPSMLNAGTRTMPARPYLSISELTAARWEKTLQDYVSKALSTSGQTGAA